MGRTRYGAAARTFGRPRPGGPSLVHPRRRRWPRVRSEDVSRAHERPQPTSTLPVLSLPFPLRPPILRSGTARIRSSQASVAGLVRRQPPPSTSAAQSAAVISSRPAPLPCRTHPHPIAVSSPPWPRSSSAGRRRPVFISSLSVAPPHRPQPSRRRPLLPARLGRPVSRPRPRRRSRPSPGGRAARGQVASARAARARVGRRALPCLTVRPRVGGRMCRPRPCGTFPPETLSSSQSLR